MTHTLQSAIHTALARGAIYQCLAQAFSLPQAAFAQTVTRGLWLATLDEAVGQLEGCDVLADTLGSIEIIHPTVDPAALSGEYTRLFSNMALTDFPPYGADYLASHIFMKAQSLADVAGFYRAFGVDIAEKTERPDHISAELEFLGYLCWKEAYAAERGLVEAFEVTISAQKRFFAEHLGRWAPLFLSRFEMITVQPFYRALASFAQAFLAAEGRWLEVSPEAVADLPMDTSAADSFICGAGDGQCPLEVGGENDVDKSC